MLILVAIDDSYATKWHVCAIKYQLDATIVATEPKWSENSEPHERTIRNYPNKKNPPEKNYPKTIRKTLLNKKPSKF